MMKIVLASGSPRRRELLEMIGLTFEVDPSSYEEVLDQSLRPQDLAIKLSLGKAQDVAQRHENAIVIGVDLLVSANGKNLGKPENAENAIKMLSELSGKTHSAVTGFTIIDSKTGKIVSESVETKIYFRQLTSTEIKKYVETGEPLDKAGGYAIQGKGALLVEKIEGDFYNIVGLPLSKLVETLRIDFGVDI